ncbi:hypothetical protein [Streptomyces decoyicus]
MTALSQLVHPDRYPRSSRYAPAWLLDLDMGPNPLRLLEDLARNLDLRPGMRILDLGYEPVIDMLTADGGEFLSFALVTARKNCTEVVPTMSLFLRS